MQRQHLNDHPSKCLPRLKLLNFSYFTGNWRAQLRFNNVMLMLWMLWCCCCGCAAHLVLSLTLLMAREENVKACLPLGNHLHALFLPKAVGSVGTLLYPKA